MVKSDDMCVDAIINFDVSPMGTEENVDPMCLEALILLPCPGDCFAATVVHSPARHLLVLMEPLSSLEASRFSESVAQVRSQDDGSCADTSETLDDAPPISVEEFLSNFTRVFSRPLLGSPTPVQVVAEDASCIARQNGLLDKKKNMCNILTAKRAEFRLMGAFGELPKMNKDELAENKMNAYLEMYNKLLSSQAIMETLTLAGIDGKAKMDLANKGFSGVPGCSPLDNVSP